ncbi:uncharacterized protein VP01_1137g4 [Puccinia sorghi]|uniref:Uncharacterized protein n=1 Tax=Puccinia sorghi TaxID=27349 RepID=A0A0L6VS89_9BASI|nr:uncharacterized protein VP01_1137g4 [Puccinia sorghi]
MDFKKKEVKSSMRCLDSTGQLSIMQDEGFPGCIGFVDGKTIPLSQKPIDENRYFDCKNRSGNDATQTSQTGHNILGRCIQKMLQRIQRDMSSSKPMFLKTKNNLQIFLLGLCSSIQ